VKEQEDKEKYETLLQKIKSSFTDIEISTLGKLVKNISLSPSVRSGNKDKLEEDVQYYEVGLRDIDTEGIITVEQCKRKNLGPASRYLVKKYSLKENDLLIPYRASRSIKVARVGSNYPTPLVTNASIIRIEMKEDTSKDLALLIQAYLSIDYVQRYILPKEVYSSKRTFSRHLISIKVLNELPIPRFTEDMVAQKDFAELYLRRISLLSKARSLNKYLRSIIVRIAKDEDETINLFLNSKEKLPHIHKKETNILNKLDELLNEFVLLEKECKTP